MRHIMNPDVANSLISKNDLKIFIFLPLEPLSGASTSRMKAMSNAGRRCDYHTERQSILRHSKN